jgi:lysozyme
MANPLVIDLSHHNDVTDFNAIRLNGTIGIIHKASEGSTYTDPEFWERRAEAGDAGLLWASYHYLHHGDIDSQIANFLTKVQPAFGERLVIDYEEEDCTLDDLRQAIRCLRNAVPFCELTVYSGHLIKEHLGDNYDPLLSTTSLWLAQYSSADELDWPQGTWPTWTLWQYTDCAAVAGVAAACDGNYFNGSVVNCCRWFDATAFPVPEPQTGPEVVVVRIAVDVPDGVAVVITVNGEVQA